MVLSKIHWLFKIVPGTILFFYPMIDKAIYVDNFINYATNNKYFGAYQVIINDLIIYLVLILLVYISFLKYVPSYFSILIRIISLILYSLYIIDYLILLNFNTHLTLSDIFKYIAIAPRYFLQAFIEFNLRTIILFSCCTFLIISFIIHKWRLQYKLINHIVTLFMTLGFICLVSYLPKDNYVHSWLYKNFIDYNLTISSEAKEYSSEFISNFDYHEEYFFSTFEQCDIECTNYSSLGDLNDDSMINVIDVVQLVTNILDENIFYIAYGDLNSDGLLNVIDSDFIKSSSDLLSTSIDSISLQIIKSAFFATRLLNLIKFSTEFM